MLLDTSFLIDLVEETNAGTPGAAVRWLTDHRHQRHWIPVICVGELAAGMRNNNLARLFLAQFRVVRLHPEVAFEAADIDRELMRTGQRLGENDNWIAGFARYYGEAVVSNDGDFDRVPGIRRIAY